MNDVRINSVELAPRAGPAASPPQPQQPSRQAAGETNAAGNSAQSTKTVQAVDINVAEKNKVAERNEQSQEQKEKQLEEAVAKLNDHVQKVQRDLKFQTDTSTGKTVITVVDRQTSEVIRQIPDDVALRLAQRLQQDEPLSLFETKA